jgi:hypothetical protein
MKALGIIALLALLAGCSATSLRCGVDDERSYVELINVPQDLSAQARHFTDLCGFAYEADQAQPAQLRIIDQTGENQ